MLCTSHSALTSFSVSRIPLRAHRRSQSRIACGAARRASSGATRRGGGGGSHLRAEDLAPRLRALAVKIALERPDHPPGQAALPTHRVAEVGPHHLVQEAQRQHPVRQRHPQGLPSRAGGVRARRLERGDGAVVRGEGHARYPRLHVHPAARVVCQRLAGRGVGGWEACLDMVAAMIRRCSGSPTSPWRNRSWKAWAMGGAVGASVTLNKGTALSFSRGGGSIYAWGLGGHLMVYKQ